MNLVKLKSQLNMHTNGPQMIYHNFLNIYIFKRIWITRQLSLVIYPLLIGLESLRSSSIRTLRNIVYPLRRHPPRYQSTDKRNRMRSSSIYRNILRLLLSLQ